MPDAVADGNSDGFSAKYWRVYRMFSIADLPPRVVRELELRCKDE